MKLTYIAGLLAVTALASAKMEVKRGGDHDGALEKAIQSGKWIEDLWGDGNYKHHDENKGEWKQPEPSKKPEEGKKEDDHKESSKPSQKPSQKPEDDHKEPSKKPENDHKEKEHHGHKDKCGYTPEEKKKFIASGQYDPCLFG